jgi:hypothetical protein
MDGHIEGINKGEKNLYTVALKNNSGHVNTKLPPNRIELIKGPQIDIKEALIEIESLLSHVS